ncbi:hypothetical protein [Streptomyces avicenniae]|uniref:hypothetical protein n=1 Tax=Streptomyces avicenniae TaxID=500153 RepID=UPI00167F1A55|nr:hypothetical protein [Streptomyces avicenniae]
MGAEYRVGEDGAGELRLTLTASEVEALGQQALLMGELLDSCFWALGMLRTGRNSRDPGGGPPSPGEWAAALRGLDRLPPRVAGTAEAVLRAFAEGPGATAHLASALGVDEATARERRARATDRAPDPWARWADGGRGGRL